MRRHRPALPAGCQAAGDVKSAAQNFKTSHKLPHPLCGALSLFPFPSPLRHPPAMLPGHFLACIALKLRFMKAVKNNSDSVAEVKEGARREEGDEMELAARGVATRGEGGGAAMNAPKNLTPKWLQMSRAQRTKLCYTFYIPPPAPHSPAPLPHPPSALCPSYCWTAPLPAGNCVIANQINGRDVIAAICIVLPKSFCAKTKKEKEQKGMKKRESLSECNEWMNVFS